jgi:bifunctional DNA-binding transcriptional regulator/antitoxin component of YhaV-PrlF toxin-antitoxin module
MRTVTMDSRGRVTLGRAFCEKLGIRPGQKLSCTVEGGVVKMAPADSPEGLGLVSPDVDPDEGPGRDAS